MTDEFITKGLQQDRYLKAIQLIDQFEKEVEAMLQELGQRMADTQPELFDPSTDPNVKSQRSSSKAFAYSRVNHYLNGPLASDDGKTQILNTHLYWMPPTEYGRTDIDGALRAFGYKIKHADQDIDNRVAEATRKKGYSLQTAGNPFDANTVFYSHANSADDLEEIAEILVEHFAEFGDRYAASRDE